MSDMSSSDVDDESRNSFIDDEAVEVASGSDSSNTSAEDTSNEASEAGSSHESSEAEEEQEEVESSDSLPTTDELMQWNGDSTSRDEDEYSADGAVADLSNAVRMYLCRDLFTRNETCEQAVVGVVLQLADIVDTSIVDSRQRDRLLRQFLARLEGLGTSVQDQLQLDEMLLQRDVGLPIDDIPDRLARFERYRAALRMAVLDCYPLSYLCVRLRKFMPKLLQGLDYAL